MRCPFLSYAPRPAAATDRAPMRGSGPRVRLAGALLAAALAAPAIAVVPNSPRVPGQYRDPGVGRAPPQAQEAPQCKGAGARGGELVLDNSPDCRAQMRIALIRAIAQMNERRPATQGR